MHNAITDVPGIQVGQAQDLDALTGCSVVLCPPGTVGGVDQRGGAPGTRETDLLRPLQMVEEVHAILLAGGSAFGLRAADGVVRFLEARGIGFPVGPTRIPLVPAAIIFDLFIGQADRRPDAEMGFLAAENASAAAPAMGNVGAGAGATLGKLGGPARAMKSGIGSASISVGPELIIGALVAVNPIGDVINPATGQILAGVREPGSDAAPFVFSDSLNVLRQRNDQARPGANTVIGVVASNARLSKAHTNKVAQMAQDGLARCIRPAHTMADGDTIFALSTGQVEADATLVGSFAAEVFSQAILNGVRAAQSAGGLPAIGAAP